MVDTNTLLTPGEAGRRLGLSGPAVKYYDDQLRPIRTESGRRLYAVGRIEHLRGLREARGTR